MAPAAGTLTLHTLHPSRSGTPECERMFDTLGYGTLNTYYADTSVEGCEGRVGLRDLDEVRRGLDM